MSDTNSTNTNFIVRTAFVVVVICNVAAVPFVLWRLGVQRGELKAVAAHSAQLESRLSEQEELIEARLRQRLEERQAANDARLEQRLEELDGLLLANDSLKAQVANHQTLAALENLVRPEDLPRIEKLLEVADTEGLVAEYQRLLGAEVERRRLEAEAAAWRLADEAKQRSLNESLAVNEIAVATQELNDRIAEVDKTQEEIERERSFFVDQISRLDWDTDESREARRLRDEIQAQIDELVAQKSELRAKTAERINALLKQYSVDAEAVEAAGSPGGA